MTLLFSEPFWQPRFWILASIAFLSLTFGLPSLNFHWWPQFLPLAAYAFGYPLFLYLIAQLKEVRLRFIFSSLFFFTLQIIQLQWLSSNPYAEGATLVIWFVLAALFGLQFGFFSWALQSFRPALALASLWALLEWARELPFHGFPWNPIGIILASNPFLKQIASIGGVYFLSFWVILSSLLLSRSIASNTRTSFAMAVSLLLIPLIFGFIRIESVKQQAKQSQEIFTYALVQPNMLPHEKTSAFRHLGFPEPLTSERQWDALKKLIRAAQAKNLSKSPFDLIAFPEGSLPHGASYITDAQALAAEAGEPLLFGGEVRIKGKSYNAALYFAPKESPAFYGKRKLLPGAEEVPFDWSRPILAKWGIFDAFTKGTTSPFLSNLPFYTLICSEECYSENGIEAKKGKARLLVAIGNDAWYETSPLLDIHALLATIRSVESGLPLLRAYNTGITCAVDSLGRFQNCLERGKAGVLVGSISLNSSFTLFSALTLPGAFSAYVLLLFGFYNRRKKL